MTPADARALALREDLECIVTTSAGLGLTTATPLQRAICRVATGRPLAELADHPHVVEAIGRPDLLWPGQPDELYLFAPSRTGKSTIVAGLALRATQTVDVAPALAVEVKGERPRYTVISIEKDKAEILFGVIANALRGPFAHLATRDPSDSRMKAWARHPSGLEVEIVVAAGKAGGAAVLSRWSIGVALDEATRMHGDERQVSVKQTRTAALDRMLPGAQIVYLGSKWATEGPVYAAGETHGGRPSREKSVIVVGWRGGEGHKLNPLYYRPGKYEEIRGKDDGEAAWLVATNQWQAPPQKLFALSYLQKLARPLARCDCNPTQRNGFPSGELPACPHNDSPPHPRQRYLAVIDPATRGNAWALVLLTVREIWDNDQALSGSVAAPKRDDTSPRRIRDAPGHHAAAPTTAACADPFGYRDNVALVRQWQGTSAAPLDPDAIWTEIADLLRPYQCNRCVSDEWAAEEHRAIARTHGIYLSPYPSSSAEKAESCQAIGAALAAHEHGHHHHRSLELHPCPALLGDLSRLERRTTLNGVQIHYPVTGDGRHCDLAAALVKGYLQVLQRPDEAAQDETADERDERLERRALRRVAEQQERQRQGDDWGGCEHEELSYD